MRLTDEEENQEDDVDDEFSERCLDLLLLLLLLLTLVLSQSVVLILMSLFELSSVILVPHSAATATRHILHDFEPNSVMHPIILKYHRLVTYFTPFSFKDKIQ